MVPFLRARFHFGFVHFPPTFLQASLSSAVLVCWSGTGITEQIPMLCEFGAACFLHGCPVGKTITEKDSHMCHGQSIVLAFLWLSPKWGISSSGLCSHQALSLTSTEGDFSTDYGPPTLHELPRDFQKQVPEQHLVRSSNRQRRKEWIRMWVSITLFK